MDAINYSLGELLAFADRLEQQGLAKPNTARGYKVAAAKILDGLSDQEAQDVRRVDVKTAVRRFHNKNPGKLSPQSLAEYQRRVQSLISEFSRYQENPVGYSGFGRGPASAPSRPRRRKAETADLVAVDAEGITTLIEVKAPPVRSGLSYEYPLREDFLAQVVLPRDLKTDEARRLCGFIMTIAADYEPRS